MNSISRYSGISPQGNTDTMSKVYVDTAGTLHLAEITADDNYTIRFFIKAEKSCTAVLYLGNVGKNIDVKMSWSEIKDTFDGKAKTTCEMYLPPGTYYIWHMKLERSTKASDYTQAPEDVEENVKSYTDNRLKEYITSREAYSEIKQTDTNIRLSVTQKIKETKEYTDGQIEGVKEYANSQISIKSDNIYLDVDKKLEKYSTTSQMNSAIQLKANEITQTVSETYATQARITDLQSQINQNASSISLKVSKSNLISEINTSAEQIKLTSNRIIIQSDNFNLTSNGTVTATNCSLTGKLTTELGNFKTIIGGGTQTFYYKSKRVGTFGMITSSYADQLGILGDVSNYDGVAIGSIGSSGIVQTFYRCNFNNAYSYENNYYNRPRYPQRSYLYKNLYTRGGYSRVSMGMQQTTLDNLHYRVSDILYKTRYRHR